MYWEMHPFNTKCVVGVNVLGDASLQYKMCYGCLMYWEMHPFSTKCVVGVNVLGDASLQYKMCYGC